MKQSKQAGFTVVEILLVLIFLAIIAFTGFYVWHAQKNTDKTLSQTGNSQVASTSKKSSSSDSTTSSQKYLTITQWSVKLPLTSDLTNAYYTELNNDSSAVYLSLTDYKGTNCAADSVSLGLIQRFTATDKDDDGNTFVSDFPSAVKIGSYYYIYQHPQAGCDGQAGNDAPLDASGAAKASDLMNSFKTASTKLVAS